MAARGSTARTCRSPPIPLHPRHGVDFHHRDAARCRARRGDAVHARAADRTWRSGAAARARDRAAHPRDRDDGGRLFRGRQHHADGRIQHLRRSARRRRRVPFGGADHGAAARRDPQSRSRRPSGLPACARLGNRAGDVVASLLGFSERFDNAEIRAGGRTRSTTRTSSPGCSCPTFMPAAASPSRSRPRAR